MILMAAYPIAGCGKERAATETGSQAIIPPEQDQSQAAMEKFMKKPPKKAR